MKRLYLLRHAKAAAAAAGMDDFDRPLAPRGREDAPRVAAFMQRSGFAPEIALCSPARRARETWDLVRPALSGAATEDFPRRLYLAEAGSLLDTVRALDDAHESALVVGHNPGILIFALGLIGRSTVNGNPFGRYPTGAVSAFDLAADRWNRIEPGKAALAGFESPGSLDQGRPEPT